MSRGDYSPLFFSVCRLFHELKSPGAQDLKQRTAEEEKFGFKRKSEFRNGP